jgi:cytochrome c-type protein NapC
VQRVPEMQTLVGQVNRFKAVRRSVVTFGSGAALVLLVALANRETSDAGFCGHCHSMRPMIEAFEASVHGGRNPSGTRTTCVVCHLPQESLASLALAKMRAGLHAYWVEIVAGTSDIDWQAKREERLRYTFDSACLSCHRDLLRTTSEDARAKIAHERFFRGNDKKCVSCHQRAGHVELSGFLYGWPRTSSPGEEKGT